jgi:hypothetical protein
LCVQKVKLLIVVPINRKKGFPHSGRASSWWCLGIVGGNVIYNSLESIVDQLAQSIPQFLPFFLVDHIFFGQGLHDLLKNGSHIQQDVLGSVVLALVLFQLLRYQQVETNRDYILHNIDQILLDVPTESLVGTALDKGTPTIHADNFGRKDL